MELFWFQKLVGKVVNSDIVQRMRAMRDSACACICTEGPIGGLVDCMETNRMEHMMNDTPFVCDWFGGVHSGR